MPARRAEKTKVPSAFVFVSRGLERPFSSRSTDAPATGSPAEFRTVPSTVIASHCCGEGLCANAVALDKLTSAAASTMRTTRHLLLIVSDEGRNVCEQFIIETKFSCLHPESCLVSRLQGILSPAMVARNGSAPRVVVCLATIHSGSES